jgi:hypothetical protein
MSFKEWTAVIMLVGQVVITAWLVNDWMGSPPETVQAAATTLIWAIVYMVVFNIVAAIVMAILISIARREEFKDEAADERDKVIATKSMRNAYFATSIAGVVTLLMLALGVDPVLAAYALFGAMMLGGTADAVSQLVYYRLG